MCRDTLFAEEPKNGPTPSKGGLPIADSIFQYCTVVCCVMLRPSKKVMQINIKGKKQDGNPLLKNNMLVLSRARPRRGRIDWSGEGGKKIKKMVSSSNFPFPESQCFTGRPYAHPLFSACCWSLPTWACLPFSSDWAAKVSCGIIEPTGGGSHVGWPYKGEPLQLGMSSAHVLGWKSQNNEQL